LLLATSLAVSAQRAHQHGDGAAMGSRNELGSTAAFDAKGVLWAVYKDSGHVLLRHSSDHGRNWSAPVRVNKTAEPIEAGGDARPKLAFGPTGEIYVTWTQPLGKPYTGFIRLARSVDQGRTFTAPITVHANRQEITHRFDSITVTRDGRVFVVWVDKRDGEAARATKTPYEGAALYFAVSDDRGATFRGDYKLAEHSCECCRIALLPQDNGSVVALWRHVFPSNVRDHAVATIYPDGHTEGFRRATFDNWVIDACPHHGPSLAVDAGGRLHAVWFDLGPEQSGAFYGVLREGGVDHLRRIGGETAEHPDLAIAGRMMAIAWKEFDGEKSQLKVMRSDDEGVTWRESSVSSSAGPSDQPHVVTANGRFYILWNTRAHPLSVFAL
jgi:hypothetical protein